MDSPFLYPINFSLLSICTGILKSMEAVEDKTEEIWATQCNNVPWAIGAKMTRCQHGADTVCWRRGHWNWTRAARSAA